MEQIASSRLDATFMALADPTRRAILARLAQGEASVSELAAPFAISQPAISKHLRILRETGLLEVEQHGRERLYALPAALTRNGNAGVIDLGCCSFRFNRTNSKRQRSPVDRRAQQHRAVRPARAVR